MSKAADNEKSLTSELLNLGIELRGKKTFKVSDEILTSVDESLEDNERRVFIEIDSYNMAKVVTGQYVILNGILDREKNKQSCIFVIIQCYEGYNPSRTEKHLKFINKSVLREKGIPYKAYTKEEFIEICESVGNTEELIDFLFDNSIKP